MKTDTTQLETEPEANPQPELDDIPAWEMIEPGRYMPRRIRGSCRGRELG